MIRPWLCALAWLLLATGCSQPPDTAYVTRAIDGDTIVLANGQRVRYIGIDTPEMRPAPEAYARQAWEANRRLVEGKRVRLERDVSETDRYGRLLRYVYVDDVFVNAELVRLGLAEARAYPPDTKHQDYLEKVETEAREAGRGIWAKRRGSLAPAPRLAYSYY
ncbi:MAG: thermonuclease family protein [Chloroflexi bacterium]|nr:thermonuclease family protein [Chloroflexota bacterium]